MTDIRRLMRKKKLTGKELGIIEVSNMALDFKHQTQGGPPGNIVDLGELRRRALELDNKEQEQIYNGYLAIHQWIMLYHNKAQIHMQQAQLQSRIITDYLIDLSICEEFRSYLRSQQANTAHTKDGSRPEAQDGTFSVPPSLRHVFDNFGIEAFLSESKGCNENIDIVREARETLLDSYYFLRGFNISIQMIGDYYEVPDVCAFCEDTRLIEELMDEFNGMSGAFHEKLTAQAQDGMEDVEEKFHISESLFYSVDYQSIKVPQSLIKQVQDSLPGFMAFTTERASSFDIILYRRKNIYKGSAR